MDAKPTETASTSNVPIPHLALRPKEAAKALHIGVQTLWQLTAARQIPHVRVGRCVLYPTDLLREWLREHAESGKPINALDTT